MTIQEQMQNTLDKLAIDLTVVWVPQGNNPRHGEIEASSRTLFIYDVDEQQAWDTFLHEVVEWKLKEVTGVYRQIINSLIEALEKVAYRNKEQFLEFLPKVMETVSKQRKVEGETL